MWIGACVWAALGSAALVGAQFGLSRTVVDGRSASELAAQAAIHERMLDSLDLGEAPYEQIATCFAPDTDAAVVEEFAAAIARSLGPERFQGSSRWSSTASGGTGSTGNPITLTYSFVPDGTLIPNGVGEGAGNSSLFAWLNGIYGSPATWQALFAQVFARWTEFSGITYVYEANDDGSTMFNNAGSLGVRGDLRIGAKFIDGNSGILAYNFFPNNGDMVLDANDSFFNITSSSSRRLRNVVSHEHGHGQGQSHVCPVQSTKLMEPFVSTSYDGPRHDDIRGVQKRYGDSYENDNSAGTATNLGAIAGGSTVTPSAFTSPTIPSGSRLSIDANGEQDFFEFSTLSASSITVTVTPVGFTYLNGPQNSNGSCSAGTNINSLTLADLAVDLIASNGSTVLASSSGAGLGVFEQISGYASGAADTFYVRVYETGSVSEPQLYSLQINVAAPPPPDAFNLVSPTNGATDVDLGPILDWDTSANASTYLVEVDNNAGMGSPEVSQVVNAPTTQLDLPDNTLAATTQYFWRVTAQGGGGNTVSSPSLSSFTTLTPPPACIGDLTGDNKTDVLDFAQFASVFGQFVTPNVPPDYDGDGQITVLDFATWVVDFGCGT